MRKKTHWSTSIYWIDMKEEKINSTDHIRKLSFSFDFIFGESKCYKRGREKKRNKYSLSGQLHSPKIKVPKTSKIFSSLLRTHAKVHHLHFNGNDRVLFFFRQCIASVVLQVVLCVCKMTEHRHPNKQFAKIRPEKKSLRSISVRTDQVNFVLVFIVLWRKKIQVFLSRFQWKQRIGWAIRNGRGKERMNRTRAYFFGDFISFSQFRQYKFMKLIVHEAGKKW